MIINDKSPDHISLMLEGLKEFFLSKQTKEKATVDSSLNLRDYNQACTGNHTSSCTATFTDTESTGFNLNRT